MLCRGGEGGERERAGGEVHVGDHVDPVGAGKLLGKVAEIDDVGAKDAEEDERLAPLSGVAPEDAEVLEKQRPGIGRNEGNDAGEAL